MGVVGFWRLARDGVRGSYTWMMHDIGGDPVRCRRRIDIITTLR